MEKTGGKRIGDNLLDSNTISEELLDIALKKQKQEREKYLGEILLEMGVPQYAINKALDRFSKRRLLGQVLLDLKILTPEQLEVVLKKQQEFKMTNDHRLLGALVVQMGYITYKSLMLALSKHFNMPICSLDSFVPNSSLQKIIGEKYAFQNKIIVMEKNPATIKLALAEPTPFLIDELQKMYGSRVKVELYLVNPIEAEICFLRLFKSL